MTRTRPQTSTSPRRTRTSRRRTGTIRHLLRTLPVAAAAVALLSAAGAPAQAQKPRFEITPYYGHSFFGGFEIDDHEFGRLDLELDNTDVQGLIVGIPLRRALHLELFVHEQETRFGLDEGPFLGAEDLGPMDVTYYHAGVTWTPPIGQVRPFASLSLGVSRLDPDSDFLPETESRFSIGLGGGAKIFFTDHIGLRLGARLLITNTGDDDLCCRNCCYEGEHDDLVQGVVSAGLIFAF